MGEFTAYVGTGTVRGSEGVYVLSIDSDSGDMRILSTAYSVDPTFLAVSPDKRFLYSTIETMSFEGRACAGVAAFSLGDKQEIRLIGRTASEGQLICHVCVDWQRRELFASSYISGTLSVHRINTDGTVAPAHNVIRHVSRGGIVPSVHFSQVTPDGKMLCVIDISLHSIYFYDLTRGRYEELCRYDLDPSEDIRPRQIVFSRQNAYVITELGKSILCFGYHPHEAEKLVLMQEVKLYPAKDDIVLEGRVSSSAVKLSPDGKLIAGATRGHQLITTFTVDADGKLRDRVFNRIKGKTPRDFCFTPDGKAILVAAQETDTLELYGIEMNGSLRAINTGFKLPCAMCVTIR